MNKAEFITAIRKIGLSTTDYIVVGSGVLCALEIRNADDVDLVVSKVAFSTLEDTGDWQKKEFPDDASSYYLTNGIYEVGVDWDSKLSVPNLSELKADEIIIEDTPFVSLERLKSWKIRKARPKDIQDIKLIDSYLSL